ncbi:hypothetical protein M7I_5959 [Glarea lozoyensis 74030]|uniref:Peroxisome membrane anchor protein Pex14p N-terminal domain-containing protein n=1 Tax=Glarea lozoyensis (strain ATCC 74030 / MF5533) TaxID=1104152 RepID=H0ETA0_GLAL7|nr:hypothetical protein M7I_5959 [Glarea lozoyensis 74030]
MSDSESGEQKGGVPSWQRVTAQKPLQEEDKPKSKTDPTSTAPMLAQARKFLEDEEVKDAPTDKKIAFLESKGVRNLKTATTSAISNTKSAPAATTKPSSPPHTTPNNNLPRIPHHLAPSRSPHNQTTPPKNPLRILLPLPPPLRNIQLPSRAHDLLPHNSPPLPRLNHLHKPTQTNREARESSQHYSYLLHPAKTRRLRVRARRPNRTLPPRHRHPNLASLLTYPLTLPHNPPRFPNHNPLHPLHLPQISHHVLRFRRREQSGIRDHNRLREGDARGDGVCAAADGELRVWRV